MGHCPVLSKFLKRRPSPVQLLFQVFCIKKALHKSLQRSRLGPEFLLYIYIYISIFYIIYVYDMHDIYIYVYVYDMHDIYIYIYDICIQPSKLALALSNCQSFSQRKTVFFLTCIGRLLSRQNCLKNICVKSKKLL